MTYTDLFQFLNLNLHSNILKLIYELQEVAQGITLNLHSNIFKLIFFEGKNRQMSMK